MSWRRLRVIIERLPPESHTKTEMRNSLSPEEYEEQARGGEPEKGRWSATEQLLAGVTDSLRSLEYILTVANSSGKGRRPQQPKPMRRPGVTRPKDDHLTEQGASFLFGLINGSAA